MRRELEAARGRLPRPDARTEVIDLANAALMPPKSVAGSAHSSAVRAGATAPRPTPRRRHTPLVAAVAGAAIVAIGVAAYVRSSPAVASPPAAEPAPTPPPVTRPAPDTSAAASTSTPEATPAAEVPPVAAPPVTPRPSPVRGDTRAATPIAPRRDNRGQGKAPTAASVTRPLAAATPALASSQPARPASSVSRQLEPPRTDAARQEPPRTDVARADTSGPQTPRPEPPRQDDARLEAPRPEPAKPAPLRSDAPIAAQTPVDERADIRGVLQRYAAAYSALSLDALRQVWPTAPEQLRAGFRGLASQRKEISDVKTVTVTGATAVAVCSVSTDVVAAVGRQRNTSMETVTFRLQKADAGWIITTVTSAR